MEFKPVKRISVSEQICEQLKEKIISGELRPGDKMPSENELCKIYEVSRTTIRQALNTLLSLGLIETRFGEGSFVKEPDDGMVMNDLLAQFYLSEKSLAEIIEFRRMIEGNVAGLACLKAVQEDVETLETIYEDMKKSKEDLKKFSMLDYDFHIAIAQISGNIYIIKIYKMIAEVLSHAFSDIVSRRGSAAGLKYHGEILQAFREKNPKKAAERMQEHMDDLYREWIGNIR